MVVGLDPQHLAEIARAVGTVAPFALRTPLVRSECLSELTGGDVFLKLENLQRTGSFKLRGAAHRITSLTAEERDRGIVTCSSGNHGRAVAFVAQQLKVDATICVPQWVDPVKLAAIKRCGATVDDHGVDYDDAERRAWDLARSRHLTFVHPFDDRHIVAGQGTITFEILEDEPDVDAILAPLSGGGLVSGIAIGVRALAATSRVVAVSAEKANVMAASLAAGKPVSLEEEKTIANALSGGIGLDNQHTFALVQSLVEHHVSVSEADIEGAIRFLCNEHRVVVEGGGAAAVAAVLADPQQFQGERLAVVVSGGNIDLAEWIRIVDVE